MPALFPALALAPFYLFFSGHSSFEDVHAIPMYVATQKECDDQAQIVDAIMSGRNTFSLSGWVNNSNKHAFCIHTGWTKDMTSGVPMGLSDFSLSAGGNTPKE